MLKPTPKKRVLFVRSPKLALLVIFGVFSLVAVNLRSLQPAAAATANTVNFQARLQTASGAVVPDGNYNVEFKLYSASTGGSAVWTEDYTYNSGSGQCSGPLGSNDCRIQTVNGYLSANLGSITAFSGINWDQKLWLTMNIGGTATTGSYPTLGDGEMSPRITLTAVPYAFSAGQLQTTSGSNTSKLSIQAPTGGSQTFVLQDQGASGTYNLLTNTSGVQLQGSTPGTAQTGSFNITGTGIAGILQAATINATTGLQTGGTTRIDSSGNLSTIGTYSGSGNITTTGGVLSIQGTGNNYFAGSIGIGTSSPQTALDVSGAISGSYGTSGAAVRHYYNVYAYGGAGSTSTGTLEIVLPNSWSSTALTFEISGYDAATANNWHATIGGTDGASSWANTSAQISGIAPFSSIRLANDSSLGKNVLLLGTTSTSWKSQFVIDEVTAGSSNQNIWGSGYSSAFLASETGITNINSPSVVQFATTSQIAGSSIQNQTTLQSANFFVQGTSGTVTATIQGSDTTQHILDIKNSTGTTIANFGSTGVLNIPAVITTFSGNANGQTALTAGINNSYTGASTVTSNGLSVTLTGAANSSGSNINNGVNLANVTTTTGNTFYGVNIGTGYNDILRYNGTQLISGTGVLQSAALSGTYSNNLTLSGSGNVYSGTSITVSGTAQAATINATTKYQLNGTDGSTTTCSSGNVLQNTVVQGGIITGGTCVANGGGVAPTIQDTYNNSATTSPQLQLSNTNGGFKIRDASSSTIGNLFQIQNSAGSTTYLGVTSSGLTESGTGTFNGLLTGSAGFTASGGAISLTGNAASSLTTTSGGLTIDTTSAAGQTIAIGNGAITHTIQVGTGAAAQTVSIGSTNGGSSLALNAGTGNLTIQTQGTGTLGIGNNAVAQTLAIGNSTGATAVTIAAGTGNLQLTTQGTGTLGIGNNAVAQTITVGNTTGSTTLNLQAGSGNINLTGAVSASSTINAVSGYKFNGTAGSTTTCSSGNVLSNAVVQGGIITGGTCAVNGAGISPTLQDGYTNSATTNPQIQLSNTNGGLKLRDASSSTIGNLFQIQDSAGSSTYFSVTSTKITAPIVNATTKFQINGTDGATTTCSSGNVLGNIVISGGIITGGSCATNGGGISPTLQNGYDNAGTTNPQIQLSNTNGGLKLRDASSSTIGNLFQIQDSAGSTTYLGVTASGATLSGYVNAANGFKYNGTAGATTTCSGGQFLQNQVVQGGITTGGTCSAAGGGGVATIGTIDGGTYSANGASISGTTMYLQSATGSHVGLVTTGTQTFGGAKTFNNAATFNDLVTIGSRPTNSATSSLLQLGDPISGGNSVTNGGTYIGLNAPSSGAGSAADLVNLQVGGSSVFLIDINGYVNAAGGFAYNGTAGTATTCSGGQFLQNQVVQGGITTGGSCAAAGGGVTTIGTIDGGTYSANGASISGTTMYLQAATGSHVGLVTTGTQTFGGNKTLTGDTLLKASSSSLFQIQDGSSNILFGANTSTSTITLGASASGNYITFTASGGLTSFGTAQHTKKITLPAEYAGAVLDAASDSSCSSANSGTMTSGFDGTTSLTNYYKWASTTTAQCYDVVVRVPIPTDFGSWASSTPLTIDAYTNNTSTSLVNVEARSTGGTLESSCNYANVTPGSTSTWSTSNSSNCTIAGTYTAGGTMTLRMRLTGNASSDVRIGTITLSYNSKF